MFNIPVTEHELSSIGFKDIFLPSFSVYLVWTLVYFTWQVLHGRFKSEEETGNDVLFNKFIYYCDKLSGRNILGFDLKSKYDILPRFKF